MSGILSSSWIVEITKKITRANFYRPYLLRSSDNRSLQATLLLFSCLISFSTVFRTATIIQLLLFWIEVRVFLFSGLLYCVFFEAVLQLLSSVGTPRHTSTVFLPDPNYLT